METLDSWNHSNPSLTWLVKPVHMTFWTHGDSGVLIFSSHWFQGDPQTLESIDPFRYASLRTATRRYAAMHLEAADQLALVGLRWSAGGGSVERGNPPPQQRGEIKTITKTGKMFRWNLNMDLLWKTSFQIFQAPNQWFSGFISNLWELWHKQQELV